MVDPRLVAGFFISGFVKWNRFFSDGYVDRTVQVSECDGKRFLALNLTVQQTVVCEKRNAFIELMRLDGPSQALS